MNGGEEWLKDARGKERVVGRERQSTQSREREELVAVGMRGERQSEGKFY